jgi:transposase
MRALDPEVVDAVWAAVEGLLPPRVENHPLGCHRRRIPDRVCFEAILIRLAMGCSWEDAERLSHTPVSDTTLRDRRDEWVAAGVFDALVDQALHAYDRVVGLDLSDSAVDGSTHKAPGGGDGTGPSPTDRGKLGWKWSALTDRHGIPLGWATEGANRHDVILFEPTLQAAARRGLLADVETLHLDRGYDIPRIVDECARHGLGDVVCGKRRAKGQGGQPKQSPPRPALADRTNEQLAHELRAAPPKHRPQTPSPPRPDRPRRHHPHHRQTHRLAKPVEPQHPPNPLSL